MPQLKIIPAFGTTIYRDVYDRVEESLQSENAIDSFKSWLEAQSVVFNDGRRFYYETLTKMGYKVVLVDDLPRLIFEWEQVKT